MEDEEGKAARGARALGKQFDVRHPRIILWPEIVPQTVR
jgi:hypothetical protein